MSKLEMQQCVLGQVFTNCYFLKNKETGELLIVDPGDYAEKVFQKVSLMQGKPVGILLTHGHFDHIMAVKEVKEKYQIPVYACRQEEAMLAEPTINMTAVYGSACSIKPDVLLDDGQIFEAAGFPSRCSTHRDIPKEAAAIISKTKVCFSAEIHCFAVLWEEPIFLAEVLLRS